MAPFDQSASSFSGQASPFAGLPQLPQIGPQQQPPLNFASPQPPTMPSPPQPAQFGAPQGAQNPMMGVMQSAMSGMPSTQGGIGGMLLAPMLGQAMWANMPQLPQIPIPGAQSQQPVSPTAKNSAAPANSPTVTSSATPTSGSSNYRQVAVDAANANGVPSDFFTALINQESGFNTGETSSAGAQGIAQIMPATAKGWGVDPNDPVASLNAAAKALKSYYDTTGSWVGAAIAYNAGLGGWQTYQQTGYLPDETKQYVKDILGVDLSGGGS